MDACPHCVADAEQARLHQVPLRSLTAEQLDRYAFKAMTTWGDAADYRHFLPRILELSALPEGDGFPGLDVDLVSRKLEMAGWEAWPASEREALRAYALARWEAALDTHPDERSAWGVLPGLSTLVGGVAPLLARWEAGEGRAFASLQLAETLVVEGEALRRGLAPSHWEGHPGWEELRAWMRAPARAEALVRAASQHSESSQEAGLLAQGFDAWRWMTT
jgi:hypothetical protein